MLSAAYAQPIQNDFKVKLHPSSFVYNFVKVTVINLSSVRLNYFGVRGDRREKKVNAKSCVCLTSLNK